MLIAADCLSLFNCFSALWVVASFRLHCGVCACIHHELSCTRVPHLESKISDQICLGVTFNPSTIFLFIVYRSLGDGSLTELFDYLYQMIDTFDTNTVNSSSTFLSVSYQEVTGIIRHLSANRKPSRAVIPDSKLSGQTERIFTMPLPKILKYFQQHRIITCKHFLKRNIFFWSFERNIS